jgi:tetratricopeptide (TPR) repeat protein
MAAHCRDLALAGALAAALLTGQTAGLGRAEFPTSGPPAAQARFLRGLLLLHSFEYDDARDEFRAAQRIAPGFAMAYWGEAMTYNEPLWDRQYREQAREALNRLAATAEARLAKAPAPREKDYLRAIEALYAAGGKHARDVAYSAAMRRLKEKYPADVDAAALYALSLLGTCDSGRDFRTYMQAAAVLEEIFASHPRHPGALHYLIHCYDDPVHAPLGLRPARLYTKVAPEAAHALHMPSHIFLALGMWEDVVSSNEHSWAASEARMQRRQLGVESRGYHAMSWLEYAYLQQGRFKDAERLLGIAARDTAATSAVAMRFHLAEMVATYRIETGRPYNLEGGFHTADIDIPAAAGEVLSGALAALNRGDRKEAERRLESLRQMRGRTTESGRRTEHPHVYAGDAQALDIMEKELTALLLVADGNTSSALDLMAQAAKIEDRMPFEFGPPVPPKPAHELLGEILLQLGRAPEAHRQFEIALQRAPQRALSMLGLARASTQMGDKPAARQIYADLLAMWQHADTPIKQAVEHSLAEL